MLYSSLQYLSQTSLLFPCFPQSLAGQVCTFWIRIAFLKDGSHTANLDLRVIRGSEKTQAPAEQSSPQTLWPAQRSVPSEHQSKVQVRQFMGKGSVTKWLGLRELFFHFPHFSYFSPACYLILASTMSPGLASSETMASGQPPTCCLRTAFWVITKSTELPKWLFFHNEHEQKTC